MDAEVKFYEVNFQVYLLQSQEYRDLDFIRCFHVFFSGLEYG